MGGAFLLPKLLILPIPRSPSLGEDRPPADQPAGNPCPEALLGRLLDNICTERRPDGIGAPGTGVARAGRAPPAHGFESPTGAPQRQPTRPLHNVLSENIPENVHREGLPERAPRERLPTEALHRAFLRRMGRNAQERTGGVPTQGALEGVCADVALGQAGRRRAYRQKAQGGRSCRNRLCAGVRAVVGGGLSGSEPSHPCVRREDRLWQPRRAHTAFLPQGVLSGPRMAIWGSVRAS